MVLQNNASPRFNVVTFLPILLLGFFGDIKTATAFKTSPSSLSNKKVKRIVRTPSLDPLIRFPPKQPADNNELLRPKYSEYPEINGDASFSGSLDDTPEYYQHLIKWALNNDNSDDSSNVFIQTSKCGHGYGLYTNRNVKAGETLFEIPSQKCLTMSQAWDHPTLGKALRVMTEDDSDQQNAALATYLASEMLSDSTDSSEFHPYLATIPDEKGSKGQDHILWWTDEEIEESSKYGLDSPFHENAMALRDWVDDMRDIITGLLVTDLYDKDESNVSIAEVRNAITASFVNVLSRSQRDDLVEDGQRMVPLLDMTQHSFAPNINYSTSSSSGSVVVKSVRDLKAGEELTLEYANELTKDEFFIVFGFRPLSIEHEKSNTVVVNGRSRTSRTAYTIPRTSSLVPVNDDSIQFTAGLLGAAFGCSVGGFVGGAIMAAAANYASRTKEGDIGTITQTLSKVALQSCNFVLLETSNNQVYQTALQHLQSGLHQLKEKDNNPNIDLNAIEKAELQVMRATRRFGDILFHDYDVINAGSIALDTVGELVEAAIDEVKIVTSNLDDDEFEKTFGFQREVSPNHKETVDEYSK